MVNVACARSADRDPAALLRGLRADLGGSEPALIAVFASPVFPLSEVLSAAQAAFPSACVIGASTSGEFTHEGDGKSSVAVFAVAGELRAYGGMASGLAGAPEAAVETALRGMPSELVDFPHRVALVLLDPLAGHGEEVALSLAGRLGDVPLVGGAAGDDLAMRATHVGLGERAESNALVVVTLFSRSPFGVGVCHGHEPLSKPLRVTRAEGNVVLEVEGRPAWDVWVEETAARSAALGLDPEASPGAHLLRFEAGLRAGGEYKVRAPLDKREGGGISFATPVPEGSVFQIMEADTKGQIDSAVEAARRARAALGDAPAAGALVFDCICRKLVLGDAYVDAVRGIAETLGAVPLAGFETYGEIAMNAGDMSGFHNTTSVVLAFGRD